MSYKEVASKKNYLFTKYLVSTFQKNSYSFKKLVMNVITKMRVLSFEFTSKRIKR